MIGLCVVREMKRTRHWGTFTKLQHGMGSLPRQTVAKSTIVFLTFWTWPRIFYPLTSEPKQNLKATIRRDLNK